MSKRILHLRSGFTLGGPEQVLLAGLEELRSEFSFTVASFVRPTRKNEFLEESARRGFQISPIEIMHSFDRSAISQLFALLPDQDLIVTHDYRALGLCVSALKQMKGDRPPLVTVSHGWTAHTWKVRIYEWLERRWYRHASRVVAVSKAKFRELQESKYSSDQLRLIENGVRIPELISQEQRQSIRTELGISENELMIITVGRLSPEKAQHILLHALARLDRDKTPFKCFLIGDGILRSDLERMIIQLNLEKMVSCVGWQSDTQKWYAAADLFALPSLTEGLPMALLEAQSYGLPAITSNVGGCGDVIVDGVIGMLVPAGEITPLQNALSKALGDSHWRDHARTQSRERIGQLYSAKRYANDWRRLYHELLT